MSFYIQDPSYQNSAYLHEALVTACVGGILGGGAYAFASKDGIELLMGDDNFKHFLEKGSFLLVVGMDDITNVYSVDSLRSLRKRYEGHLFVKAYIHKGKGSTFHPKYSWFTNKDGGMLVLGSGNLTQKGLRQNREAYAVVQYNKMEMDKIVQGWNSWVEHSEPFLFDINEDIVYECARRNTRKMNAVVHFQRQMGDASEIEHLMKYLEVFRGQPKDKVQVKRDRFASEAGAEINMSMYDEDLGVSYWTIYPESEVLIAEIPKSGNRWQQVNFDKKTFEEFFGATCGENGAYRIVFRNMRHDGVLNEIEVRPGVSVSSQNYRFELDAAKGVGYPSGKYRPLGVFAKVSPRNFMYELIMPGDKAYEACLKVMNASMPYSPDRMRRIRYQCREIFEDTSQLALWNRLDVEKNES